MLKLKNSQLIEAVEFLEIVELKPKASRVRSKLNRLLGAKVEQLYQDEMDLLNRFGRKDENGKLLVIDNNYELVEETALAYHQEKANLMEEEILINIDELKDKVSVLIQDLEDSEETYSGIKAEILDLILDKLEEEIRH